MTRSQKLLPGQRVRYAFTAEPWDPSFFKRWWMLIRGGARVVAITDRETVVMRIGGAEMNRRSPRRVIYTLPRAPLHVRHVGNNLVIDLGREKLHIGHGVDRFIAEADAWVSSDQPQPVTSKPVLHVPPAPIPNYGLIRFLTVVGWFAVFGITRLAGATPANLFGAGALVHGSRFLYELIGLIVVGLLVGLAALLFLALAFLLPPVGWVGHAVRRPATVLLDVMGVDRAKRARAKSAQDRRAAQIAAAGRVQPLVSQPWDGSQRASDGHAPGSQVSDPAEPAEDTESRSH